MKNLIKGGSFKYAMLMLLFTLTQAIAWAQDSTTSATTTTTTQTSTTEQTTWYTEPWVWVGGGVVLILLILALVRGSRSGTERTDKVTITKTRSSDTV